MRNPTLELKSSLSTLISLSIAPKAKTNPMLQIQEPIAFPNAKPTSPIALEVTETTSSGEVVTRLTMVAPINTLDSLRARDISSAPLINNSADLSSKNPESIKMAKLTAMPIALASFLKPYPPQPYPSDNTRPRNLFGYLPQSSALCFSIP